MTSLIKSICKGLTNQPEKKLTVGDQVRAVNELARKAWEFTVSSSKAYQQALNLSDDDIETMDHHDACVLVTLPTGREICIIAKNTCGSPYGSTWTMLLQVRTKPELPGIGGGTTFISALPIEDHNLVLEAIALGKTKIIKARVWP